MDLYCETIKKLIGEEKEKIRVNLHLSLQMVNWCGIF